MSTTIDFRTGIAAPPLSDEEWEQILEELGDIAPPDAPLLSEYDVSREGIYGNHD